MHRAVPVARPVRCRVMPQYRRTRRGFPVEEWRFRPRACLRDGIRLLLEFASRFPRGSCPWQHTRVDQERMPSNCLRPFRSRWRIALDPHYFRPDCFRILFSVPGAKSSLGFPGTVTRPGFDACLNWRWLPRVAARFQPSSASIRSISLTFIA